MGLFSKKVKKKVEVQVQPEKKEVQAQPEKVLVPRVKRGFKDIDKITINFTTSLELYLDYHGVLNSDNYKCGTFFLTQGYYHGVGVAHHGSPISNLVKLMYEGSTHEVIPWDYARSVISLMWAHPRVDIENTKDIPIDTLNKLYPWNDLRAVTKFAIVFLQHAEELGFRYRITDGSRSIIIDDLVTLQPFADKNFIFDRCCEYKGSGAKNRFGDVYYESIVYLNNLNDLFDNLYGVRFDYDMRYRERIAPIPRIDGSDVGLITQAI